MLLSKIEKGTFSFVSLESLSLALSTCSAPPIPWQLSSLSFSILPVPLPRCIFHWWGRFFLFLLSAFVCPVICSTRRQIVPPSSAQVVPWRRPTAKWCDRYDLPKRAAVPSCCCIYIQMCTLKNGKTDADGGAWSSLHCARVPVLVSKVAVQEKCGVHVEQVANKKGIVWHCWRLFFLSLSLFWWRLNCRSCCEQTFFGGSWDNNVFVFIVSVISLNLFIHK